MNVFFFYWETWEDNFEFEMDDFLMDLEEADHADEDKQSDEVKKSNFISIDV